jgi:hypothetical protein
MGELSELTLKKKEKVTIPLVFAKAEVTWNFN